MATYGRSAKQQARSLNAAERKVQAVELRTKYNLTFVEIARRLNCAESTVRGYVNQTITATHKDAENLAREFVEKVCTEIEAIRAALYQRCQNGDLRAIDRFDKLVHRQAKLLGAYLLDTPAPTTNNTFVLVSGHNTPMQQHPTFMLHTGDVVDNDAG